MTGGLDPLGKRALFDPQVAAAPDRISPGARNEGRTALFSAAPRRPGTVIIECSSCKSRTRASVIDLGVRLASLSAWLPLRRHAHWLRCPSCNRWQWCRIGWTE
jgi:hypothetical protein